MLSNIVSMSNSYIHQHSLFNANKVVDVARLGFHVKVKGPGVAGAAGKVHHDDLVKSDVQRGLVDEDEPPLQWIQQASGRLVGTADSLCPGMTVNRHSLLYGVVSLL